MTPTKTNNQSKNLSLMAKQSGIHQIRGKVGEHSYYRQTGVEGGLIRSINPGLSNRVKTDEAFENTRLNNREFGQAGRLASMLSQYIAPKFRPMVLPFSQSKMAKVLLEYIKLDTTAPWGGRNLTPSNSGDAQVDALNAVVKNRFEDFGIQITGNEESNTVNIATTEQTLSKARSIGATGLKLKFVAATSWIGTYSATDAKYAQSYARANVYNSSIETDDIATDAFNYQLRPTPPVGWPAFEAERMGVLIVMPYREVGGDEYILQEHCTYFAWLLADGRII